MIGTRWYQAPEVISVEKQYDQAIDIWSLGCVLHEMAYAIGIKHEPRDRILFPGKSCFPLSPCEKTKSEDVKVVNKKDQMKLILEYLGQVSEQDLSFMTDKPGIKYIKEMCKAVKVSKPHSILDTDLETLKDLMLQFNPFFRSTAAEIIKKKIFDQMRISK